MPGSDITEQNRTVPAASGVSALCDQLQNKATHLELEGEGAGEAPPEGASAERRRERQRSRSPATRIRHLREDVKDLKEEAKELKDSLRVAVLERDDARDDCARQCRAANGLESERDRLKGELQAVVAQRDAQQTQLNQQIAELAVLRHVAAQPVAPQPAPQHQLPQAYPYQGRGGRGGGRSGGRHFAPQQQQRAAQVADLVLGALTSNQSPQRPRRQQGRGNYNQHAYEHALQNQQFPPPGYPQLGYAPNPYEAPAQAPPAQQGDAVIRDSSGNAV